ncbi:hypothetical protein [Pseudomonas sp. efr-133-TYG-103a]|uniref:hypothetical protein n=1 Tax=Pseudomonas sp. efr-133-TYG-103a TaxID=3040308 RepID=UPI0025565B83|nr:hypothetical protein [Pseudomonas sp. efr-133-TYG-103a]
MSSTLVKKNIRSLLQHSPVSLQLAIADLFWMLWESKLQLYRANRLRKRGMAEFKMSEEQTAKSECHILASGWSLNYTFNTIPRSAAYVIGFNYSFLKCPDPDIHFIECASHKDKRFIQATTWIYSGLKKSKAFDRSKIVFKNISELKNSHNMIAGLYSDNGLFMQDRHFRIFSPQGVPHILKKALAERSVLPQAVSSVISMIFLARNMGFKNIVIHGLDFGGPHFYGSSPEAMIFDDAADIGLVPLSDEMVTPHKTAIGESGVGTRTLLIELKRSLEQEGVTLLSASKVSPSSELLGVWVPEGAGVDNAS